MNFQRFENLIWIFAKMKRRREREKKNKINFPLAAQADVCEESYETVSRSIEMSFFIATESISGAR